MLLVVVVVLLAVAVAHDVHARVHFALAEDLYAFPKYRLTFLNGLPVLNDTAQRWLEEGLKGGELEFLDQPWNAQMHPPSNLRTIAAQHDDDEHQRPFENPTTDVGSHDSRPGFTLQKMKLSENTQYICLIPPPVEEPVRPADEHKQDESSPAQSWSLLQPLSGSCLYHRQGWFTYSYCHNNAVRQFREMAHSHPHPPGGYVPEEDPEWEAYTLGQSTSARDEGRDLAVNQQQAALQNNVDIVATAGHRYLKQTWGDGTVCDKTGGPREIEVQFHCSMTMTDTILFVKETKTCHYVMVIHTPRLCGEPGFKTRLEQREEAFIRCREIVDSPDALAAVKGRMPESAYPMKRRERTGVIPPPPVPGTLKEVEGDEQTAMVDALEWFTRALEGPSKKTTTGAGGQIDSLAEKIRKAKERMEAKGLLKKDRDPQAKQQQQQEETGDEDDGSPFNVIPGEDGNLIIEFLDAEELLAGQDG
ncbi:hypothetical protein SCHPADRAFT_853699 [Schizopora paradoxa]|uniref:Protein OS-9 homolog n=1 Tax=Schizopora paradoxa TaxID=27342 RepID=A0A0H2RT36_9AGAM|nr:hypothetical protein SCHPADRAFT_853699 [Schizopora paradoxa]